VDSAGNAYITGSVGTFGSPVFPVTTGAFQTASGGNQDAFVTKLNASGSALVYSTYLGGNDTDQGSAIAVDSAGNAYVTGYTLSTNFPTTPGAFQVAMGGYYTAFVTKLNAAGSALVYSTYLDGNQISEAFGIAVDSAGNAYVAGDTNSYNFPTTTGAFQVSLLGTFNAFVTKLNAAGSAPVYSTYFGGNGNDRPFGIVLDSSNNAYVTGQTSSTNFPTTAGAFQTATGGGEDAFVTKLNAAGSALVYSTYLGGSNNDFGYGIAVDSSGNAYITGNTQSTDYPTANAFEPVVCANSCPSGGGIVSKLNASGSALVYSTYLGGNATGHGIAVDSAGNAYVALTGSTSFFPTLVNPIPATCGTCTDLNSFVIVANLNAAGSALIYSTYFTGSTTSTGIAVDSAGNAYLTGSAQTTFPTTPGAYQTSGAFGGTFVAKIALASPAPSASLSAASLTFSAQNVGTTSASQTETVTNTGSANLILSTATLAGTNAGDFAKSADTCTGATVTPNSTCSVSVTFKPSAAGTRSASLSFADNATDSPQVVTLSGTGTVPAAPAVTFNPTSVAFGNQPVNTTSSPSQVVVLTNSGTASLTGIAIYFTGANPTVFGQANNCSTTLAAGASCNISVTFTPTAAIA
jgi:Beta-propeller repeat/Abnormal spindle-like microcephaly-assoc'd, ASPM-SPD-2-Hydin